MQIHACVRANTHTRTPQYDRKKLKRAKIRIMINSYLNYFRERKSYDLYISKSLSHEAITFVYSIAFLAELKDSAIYQVAKTRFLIAKNWDRTLKRNTAMEILIREPHIPFLYLLE